MKSFLQRAACTAALISALPAGASAGGYNFLEGGFLYRDAYDDNGAGVRVAGSFNVLPPLAAVAEFSHSNNIDQFGVGGLFHTPIRRNLDLVAGASLEHVDTGGNSDTGVGVRAGVRWALAPKLEVGPELRYVSALDGTTSFRVNVLYEIAPRLSLQGAGQVGDDERVEAGLRYQFGAL